MMRNFVLLRFLLLCGCVVTTANAADLPLPVAEVQRTEPVDFGKEVVPILKAEFRCRDLSKSVP